MLKQRDREGGTSGLGCSCLGLCVASPASSSKIQRGQTLPLCKGLILLRCCALCFGGLLELQKAGSASCLHAAKASRKLCSGVSPSSA